MAVSNAELDESEAGAGEAVDGKDEARDERAERSDPVSLTE
jgi:hypothetical protein